MLSVRRAAPLLLPLANFYPRPPRGGRLIAGPKVPSSDIFLSTPSVRRATAQHGVTQCPLQISTHAFREEGDGISSWTMCLSREFLSTPSARRATSPWAIRPARNPYFYPRPPRGGRQSGLKIMDVHEPGFYPRPPRGGRRCLFGPDCRRQEFLSTPSARRATCHTRNQPPAQEISIHALREEGDLRPLAHSPC